MIYARQHSQLTMKTSLMQKKSVPKKSIQEKSAKTITQSPPIEALLEVMARLRDPDCGCAWDIKQTHETIVPYTIEEAYEVADAVNRKDTEDLCDELGDLLLQVVFQARIAEEAGNFDFDAVVRCITEKMIRRHPHVFGDVRFANEAEQNEAWEAIKQRERQDKKQNDNKQSKDQNGVLDGVASTLPPTIRAVKLQKRAARVGFDWQAPASVIAKIREEIAEVEDALNYPEDSHDNRAQKIEEEVGDLLFATINLARKCGVNPDQAISKTNDKFTSRFKEIEDIAHKKGEDINSLNLTTLEAYWQAAKRKEKS